MSGQKEVTQDVLNLDKNMTIREADENGLVWYQPYEQPFKLLGFYWFNQDKVYRRFPVNPTPALPEGVEILSNHTAGGQVKFRSNTNRVTLKVKLPDSGKMYHMPATGNSGFDLYVGEPGQEKFYRIGMFPFDAKEYTVEVFDCDDNAMRNFTINFPLYNGVEEVQIGLDEGAEVQTPAPFTDDRPIIVYGTSITQGGCASKPGACYTNTLSRYLNRPFINLGFSGNGRGEPEVAGHIASIENPAMFVLDYEANCVDTETLERTLPEFIRILREKHPETPILVVSKIRYAQEALDDGEQHQKTHHKISYREACKKIEIENVEKCKQAGDKNIYFFDGSNLLGEDYYECSVDGCHPTDMGFYRMAKGLAPVIKDILD
jgi:lysophospholipase L1-like esterase